MKRIAISICIAIAAFSLGACEKQSAENLPAKYLHKRDANPSGSGHSSTAPAHGETLKAPDAGHQG